MNVELLAGGYSTNYTETLNLAQKYDANAKAWVNITSMPTPRGDVMCAALNGEFVVAGGFYDPTNQFTPASFRTEVQAYNPATGDFPASLPSIEYGSSYVKWPTSPDQADKKALQTSARACRDV